MSKENEQEFSLQLLRSGDRAEIARLVDAYSTKIYRLALKMLANPQDAEDVLQNTFLKAIQALPKFEARSSLSTWLYRIAVNESLMLIRRRKPEIDISLKKDDDESELELTHFSDWCCLPESELISAEAQEHLDEAVQKLSEKLRVVFILRDIEKLSIAETSEALEISEAAVKLRLLRARLKLREILSKYYVERLDSEKKDEKQS
ncbi:MAG: sigma-70 family RNA polymerase sigma factor [Anaerolineae bacterium]|jgi:RNA polymerase sigma-70 factor, ECF subfamily|nr:sigma-70 family RNA polymerase sigma factor [Anaerolineae bacterium]MBT7074483.1 sigma-70 family RNA polymerase sigma factor [Anaerolineae bacterium]MBT7783605.1 sigma-70 family RNA polymerase sigma factor [Anaerolineae bacterium]